MMTNFRSYRRIARRWGAVFLVPLSMATVPGCATTSTRPPERPAEREVLIGGLFSLTGPWQGLGQNGAAALEIAIADVNQYLAGNAANIRFAAAIEDTRLDPNVALAKATELRARGAPLLIGPQSSTEVAHLKAFVDANGLLLVSPSSTAGTLAIAGDNVFRYTPADSLEGVALSALMWADGIRHIIPVWLDDEGNGDLVKAVRARFAGLGGTVASGYKYGTGAAERSQISAALAPQIRTAVQQYGSDKVAVYATGFDELIQLFEAICSDPVFASVKWYGSDGMARNAALLANAQATQFAMRVGYANPVFGLEEGARDVWQPLVARIRARTNSEPDAFALAVYDAVWAVARGYVASGATLSADQLKLAFTTAASTHFGATGWTVLNTAGDRKYGDFDFWAVREVDGVPRWLRVARYETRTGNIVRSEIAK